MKAGANYCPGVGTALGPLLSHSPLPALALTLSLCLAGDQRKALSSQVPWDPSESRLRPDGLPWSAGQCLGPYHPMQGEGLPDWGFGTESLHSPVPRKGLSGQGPRSPRWLPPGRGVFPVCAPLFVSHCTSDTGAVIHAWECASTATCPLCARGPLWGAGVWGRHCLWVRVRAHVPSVPPGRVSVYVHICVCTCMSTGVVRVSESGLGALWLQPSRLTPALQRGWCATFA